MVNPGWEIEVEDEVDGGRSVEERSWIKAESVIGKEQVSLAEIKSLSP